jgi:hypothetical protein
MGAYTELIFGATLKRDTPIEIIETLKYMLGGTGLLPKNTIPEDLCSYLFRHGSYYFAINEPVCKMWLDDIDKRWHISTRSNIKNYNNEIETFLEWIEPYIVYGSGSRDLHAIAIYQEDKEPKLYYLK